MKTRFISSFIAVIITASGILLTSSCDEKETEQEISAPQLVSTEPENGISDLDCTSLDIKFTFDSAVLLADGGQSRISAGEAMVSDVNVLARNVIVTVTGLQLGKSYTVTIPEGCLVSLRAPDISVKPVTFSFSMKPEPEIPPVPTYWQSAAAAVAAMGTGWNLGNTLDANSYDWKSTTPGWIVQSTSGKTSDWETAWGQPVTEPKLLTMFANAGFGAIRVPVTWAEHIDEDGIVDQAWMDRVEEVVKYVVNNGMYCILNVHHDTGEIGWLHCDKATYTKVSKKFYSLWTQIATRFAGYGEKLIFESFNEMLDGNNRWNTTTSECYSYIDKYNQDFVRAVRATGGNNGCRNLVVNTYAASTAPDAMSAFTIPEDSVEGHLIAEVHSYAPYRFAFEMENPADQLTVFDSNCEKEVKSIIYDIDRCLIKRGIPVILGEYGATSKVGEKEMAKQAACYVSTAKKYGIACFYWMALSDGADRAKPAWTKPALKDAILSAYKDN